MVHLGGTQKVDFFGTCFGGDGVNLFQHKSGRRHLWHLIVSETMGSALRARADVRWSIGARDQV